MEPVAASGSRSESMIECLNHGCRWTAALLSAFLVLSSCAPAPCRGASDVSWGENAYETESLQQNDASASHGTPVRGDVRLRPGPGWPGEPTGPAGCCDAPGRSAASRDPLWGGHGL